jgi:hypothetical protein
MRRPDHAACARSRLTTRSDGRRLIVPQREQSEAGESRGVVERQRTASTSTDQSGNHVHSSSSGTIGLALTTRARRSPVVMLSWRWCTAFEAVATAVFARRASSVRVRPRIRTARANSLLNVIREVMGAPAMVGSRSGARTLSGSTESGPCAPPALRPAWRGARVLAERPGASTRPRWGAAEPSTGSLVDPAMAGLRVAVLLTGTRDSVAAARRRDAGCGSRVPEHERGGCGCAGVTCRSMHTAAVAV